MMRQQGIASRGSATLIMKARKHKKKKSASSAAAPQGDHKLGQGREIARRGRRTGVLRSSLTNKHALHARTKQHTRSPLVLGIKQCEWATDVWLWKKKKKVNAGRWCLINYIARSHGGGNRAKGTGVVCYGAGHNERQWHHRGRHNRVSRTNRHFGAARLLS